MAKAGKPNTPTMKDVGKAIQQITNAIVKMAKVLTDLNNRLSIVEKKPIESTINMLSESELAEVGLNKTKDS